MGNYYDELTGQYPISKTLRNRLIPVGKTINFIRENHILDRDIQRKQDYILVKKMIDAYHLELINQSLEGKRLQNLENAAALYLLNRRTEVQEKELETLFDALRKEIVSYLRAHEKFGILNKAELIEKELPLKAESEEEYNALKNFEKFTTYFTNFNVVRQNLYSAEKKSSTVAYRLIEENLPRFLDNKKVFEIIQNRAMNLRDMRETLDKYRIDSVDELFEVDEFNYVLTQNGIDIYNVVIGDLNSRINLYNQQNKSEAKIPKMKTLYKQILAEREKVFVVDEFTSDEEIMQALADYAGVIQHFLDVDNDDGIYSFLEALEKAFPEGIFVKNDANLTGLSVSCGGKWNYFTQQLSASYDDEYTGRKKINTEAYDNEKEKNLKKIKSYSIGKLQGICGDVHIIDAYECRLKCDIENAMGKLGEFHAISEKHDFSKRLADHTEAVQTIKSFLDSIKQLEADIKLLSGTGMETERDYVFYGEHAAVLDELQTVDRLYNMTRNYMTKKPFSTEKVKLNFDRTTLLAGWDNNKERDNLGVLLEKDGQYYLGIMDRNNSGILNSLPAESKQCYRKMVYKLLPGPNKMLPKVFFSNKRKDEFMPTDELLEKYNRGTHIKGENFSLEDCHALIDFYKESINRHEDWKNFGFHFSTTDTYKDISGFYSEVKNQGYKIEFQWVDADYIDQLVEKGKLYLFQIYNKDFSEYSKGNYNLHTLYWKMLFDERNLSDVVYVLNGGAEVFYRPASIKGEQIITHKAGMAIPNKRHAEDKMSSTFAYDIVKDKRYTEDSFELHVPITMNFKAPGARNFNTKVNRILKKSPGVHVIGIDRGERNLLYVVVVAPDGRIVEQMSLNSILTSYKEKEVSVNYHTLLYAREKQRDEARKSWETIESIKELKEGYMSQVVHVIAQLVIKYNAVIAIEDLNFGFMRGRQKVEKQVYQKFEKMLIDKLNYLVMDKSREQNEPWKVGGSLNALQLTDKFESFKKLGKQTGIIYYVPAWMTSKIDPTTGFVNLFYLKYENQEKSRAFFAKFDSISFNGKYFEFSFDYHNFTYKADGSRTKWTVCSCGERIEKFRNSDAKNSWNDRIVNPTNMLKELFDRYGIVYQNGENLAEKIIVVEDSRFYKELYHCLSLILQIRNSSKDGSRDYLQSSVMNNRGEFFNSENAGEFLPKDADANGAYNIARKGLWVLQQIKNTEEEELPRIKLAISNRDWLCYAQENING
jgi:CRISPR-associated protein Cpf1